MRPEEAAAVITTDDLPTYLRKDTAELLAEYARAKAADGDDSATVACAVAQLLFDIAYYEPEEVPDLEEVLGGSWPSPSNQARRAAGGDSVSAAPPTGYRLASLLRSLRLARECGDKDAEAAAQRDLTNPGWQYRDEAARPSRAGK